MIRIDFKNPKGMQKFWGAARPEELSLIFECLLKSGFSGPLGWRDPAYLAFKRPISNGLFIRVIFHSFGEFPSGIFEFDTEIHVCSREVFEVEMNLKLWDQDFLVENKKEDEYATLWVVDLSHLKWNFVPGSNPIWKIKPDELSGGSEAVEWFRDWKEFGENYINNINGINRAIEILIGIPSYVPSSWVKSNGPVTPAAYEYASILLALEGRLNEANDLLVSVEREITSIGLQGELRPSEKLMLRRIQKIMDWANSKLM